MLYLLAYVAAMFFYALPVALVRKKVVAAVIFAVWGVGQITYAAGFPEPITQAIIYAAAFGYCLTRIFLHPHRWTTRCVGAVVAFLPLAVVSWHWATTPGLDPWWTIYVLAWLQLLLAIRPSVAAHAYRELLSSEKRRRDVLKFAAA